MNGGQKQTTRLYAWIAEDSAGIEGIIAVPTTHGIFPLVATDEKLARTLADQAFVAAHARKTTPKLVAFDRAHLLWPK